MFDANQNHPPEKTDAMVPTPVPPGSMTDRVVAWASGRLRGPAGEALIVGVGLVVAYLLLRMSPVVAIGAFRDDAIYVSLGKALAAHEGYRSIYAVGAPVHMKYPPGLPAIYAVLWWLGGTLSSVESLAKTLDLVVCGAAASFIWWVGRARLGLSTPLTLGFAISPFLLESSIQYFNLAISEPYFLLGWAAALALHYRLEDAGPGRKRIGLSLALGLIVAAATLIRSQALVLLPAFALALAMRRAGWRVLGAFAASASIPVAGWFWLHSRLVARGPVSLQPDEASYLTWLPWDRPVELLKSFASAAAWNWEAYWKIMPLNLSGSWVLGVVLCSGLLALAVGGGLRLVKRHPALSLTTAANATLIMLWPFPQDRFLLPILPFAGLLVAAGALWTGQRWRALTSRPALVLLAILAAVIALRQVSIRRYAYSGEDPVATTGITYPSYYLASNTGYLAILSRWTLEHTSPDDRMLVEFPAGLFLHTGRQGVASAPADNQTAPIVFRTPGEFLTRRIVEDNITVIGLGNLQAQMAPEIALVQRSCPEALEFAGSASPGALPVFFRVVRDDRCLAALARELRYGARGDAEDQSRQ
ncbi:MAG: hypothetical protein JSV86_02065 [Gemmatimonadota bacterium]|nr:MAG: hypothetical protein JSV86_02065 [Gemmatimonadota bacterium]